MTRIQKPENARPSTKAARAAKTRKIIEDRIDREYVRMLADKDVHADIKKEIRAERKAKGRE